MKSKHVIQTVALTLILTTVGIYVPTVVMQKHLINLQ